MTTPDRPIPIRINDNFKFDDPAYDIDAFYTECRDSRDRNTIRANIDGGIYAAITRWLQINRFPKYRTFADVVRDALRHRLEYLNHGHPNAARDDEMWKALDVYTRQAQLETRVERSRANEEFVVKLNERCHEFLTREDWAELDGALVDASDAFDYLPEPFKARAKLTVEKFKPYLLGRVW